jgi:nucleoid-associated protein YgaU
MDTLRNKRFEAYDYVCRYTTVPYYYDTLGQRSVYGIGSNMLKNIAFTSHEVKETDTLDSLALKYYNNPSYWWVIAYFNDLQDAFVKLSDKLDVIQIPAIASIEFGDLR